MEKNKHLNFYQAAPNLILQDLNGNPVQLASLWQERPLLLAFTRHFGCTQCKEMLEELVEGKEKIEKAGLNLAVVTQGTPEAAALFASRYAPGLFLLSDPERKSYEAFGLERGNLFQTFLNPSVWSAVSRARKKGYHVEPPPEGQDAMQMSGTFIITTDGHIALPYYYDHIADHSPLELLLSGVLNNVELMLRLNNRLDKACRLRARELLARLGLGERLHNLPGQMSGGQQQRVAIARVLIHNPSLVLADKPTASLDTERASRVVETFTGLIHEQKRAGIMVTHDLRMVGFVDRVLMMRDGKLVKVYSTHDEIMQLATGGRE